MWNFGRLFVMEVRLLIECVFRLSLRISVDIIRILVSGVGNVVVKCGSN